MKIAILGYGTIKLNWVEPRETRPFMRDWSLFD